jgi:hypothetical protein
MKDIPSCPVCGAEHNDWSYLNTCANCGTVFRYCVKEWEFIVEIVE